MSISEQAARAVRIEDYSYELPPGRIAQAPILPAENAKLLHYLGGRIEDHRFGALPTLLPEDSLLVFNDTKVIRARLRFRKPTGARIQIFLLEPNRPSNYVESFATTGCCEWHCLVGNAKRWHDETLSLSLPNGGTIEARKSEGQNNLIAFSWRGEIPFAQLLLEAGSIPIPPYLGRESTPDDDQWYQTIFAQAEGSVAAPTAGLHFTEELLDSLEAGGHSMARTTLHVGAGTFLPVKSEAMGDHPMHTERIVVTTTLLKRLLSHKGPRFAVGTTSLRTLESLYYLGVQLKDAAGRSPSSNEAKSALLHVEQWAPYRSASPIPYEEALALLMAYMEYRRVETLEASTGLLIVPGYEYKSVRGLVTNFHQPHSTLLLLVAAMMGRDWERVYAHALSHDYRFLSYGDGMLIEGEGGRTLGIID